MSACPQCGTAAKPTDKFCNVCGTPLARAGAAAPAPGQPQYAAPAPAPAQYGAPAPGPAYGAQPPAAQYGGMPGQPQAARCQLGHEIAPGASYCPQGHPIALDQMQFASDAYGGAPPGYAPQAPQQAFGAPPPASPYGAPPAPPQGYAPPQQQGYAPPPPQGFAPPQQQGYAPAPAPQNPPFGAPAPGFGAPPPQAAYQPPAQPGYAPPAAVPAPAYPGYNDTSRDAAPPRVLRGFLVSYGTNPSGDFWPLTGGRHVVGRLGAGDGIDIALQDPTISSRHAALVVDAAVGTITLEDTGSTNGTFVNDEHIGFNGRRDLRDGDRLRFGGYTTVVKVIARI